MARVAVLLVCAVWLTVPQARQGGSPAAPKPLVPAAASSIAASPDDFVGQNVTVTAAVERIVSPISFTVDQDPKKAAADVLVLVDLLNAPLEINSYVTIIGEVVRHEGRPAIRATSVLTSAMIDIAKRPPPPMSADEAAFDKTMKRIGPAFNAIRQRVVAAGGESLEDEASTLKAAFAEVETFWTKHEKPDAQKWAGDARAQAVELARAIADEKWDEAKAAVGLLQQSCSACHTAYRQRLDDGSYRIRMGK